MSLFVHSQNNSNLGARIATFLRKPSFGKTLCQEIEEMTASAFKDITGNGV